MKMAGVFIILFWLGERTCLYEYFLLSLLLCDSQLSQNQTFEDGVLDFWKLWFFTIFWF